MAKTGFWLRGAKGKLAGTTIYKGKTGTIQREIVSPSNPRSEGQMRQRARFLSAVRFYSRANQRYFKFAFESKRQGESDFNAFMRNNIRLAPYISQPQSNAIGFPMVAPWLMTMGSLSSALTTIINGPQLAPGRVACTLRFRIKDGEVGSTIAAISESIMSAYNGLQVGDIVTVVTMNSEVRGASYPYDLDAEGVGNDSPNWETSQFRLSLTDERELVEVAGLGTETDEEGHTYIVKQCGFANQSCGGCVTFSRYNNGKTQVSTTSLSLNETAMSAYNTMMSEEHIASVVAHWGAQAPAILQGAIADTNPEPVPEPIPTVSRIEGSVLAGARSCILQSDLKTPFAAADGTKFILAMAGQFGQTPNHFKNNVVLTANGGTISGQITSDIVDGTLTLTQNLSADGTIQFAIESNADFAVNTTIVLGMVVVGNSVIYNDSYTTPARRVIAENEFFSTAFYTMGLPATGVFEEGDKVVISVESAEKSGFITFDQFVPGDPEEDEPSILKSADNILGIEIESNYATDDYTQLSIYTDSVKLGYEATFKVVSVTRSGVEYPIANN